ncbi:MAG: zinc metalloprotease HtpX, partial [Deltaproteobacteria bacterium]
MNELNGIKNEIYTSIQSLLLVLSLALLLGVMGWLIGGQSFGLMAVAAVVLLYLIHPMVSPQVILRLQKARRLHDHEAPQLFAQLQALSERARLPRLPMLYYVPADAMNAFSVGNRESAAIALTDGLLRRLDFHEITGVLAHEISHLRHNDMRIMGFAGLTSQLIRMLSLLGQILLLLNLPLLLWGHYTLSWSAILLLIFAPTISAIIQLALSRTREYRADLGAVKLMGDGRALASALAKMEAYQNRILRAIFWPGYGRIPEGALLRTHPNTNKRIQRLLENQAYRSDDDHYPGMSSKPGYPPRAAIRFPE